MSYQSKSKVISPLTGRLGDRPIGLARYIREKTHNGFDLVQIALEIAANRKAANRDRMDAIKLLIDRAFGKALETSIALTGELGPEQTASALASLTVEQLTALADSLPTLQRLNSGTNGGTAEQASVKVLVSPDDSKP